MSLLNIVVVGAIVLSIACVAVIDILARIRNAKMEAGNHQPLPRYWILPNTGLSSSMPESNASPKVTADDMPEDSRPQKKEDASEKETVSG